MKKFLSIICSLAVLATCGVTTAFAEDVESTTENITEVDSTTENTTEETVTETTTDAETNAEEDYILGDVNDDGKINAKDAVAMLYIYVDYIAASNDKDADAMKKAYKKSGDVDGNGRVNGIDAIYTLRYYTYVLAYPDTTLKIDEFVEKDRKGELENTDTEELREAKKKVDEEARYESFVVHN